MSRLGKRVARSKALGFLLVVLSILLLPVILPIALIQDQLRTRRIAKVVCSFVCVSCGTPLGTEALRLGNARWSEIIADSHRRFSGIKFRTLRDIHAVCPKCGCEYMYRDADFSLVVRPQQECAQPKRSSHPPPRWVGRVLRTRQPTSRRNRSLWACPHLHVVGQVRGSFY